MVCREFLLLVSASPLAALDLDLHILLKMAMDCYSISLETSAKDFQSSLVSNNWVVTSSSHATAMATTPLHRAPQLPFHSQATHISSSSD
jgi:hypothetical protein